jgi:CheY-like chemotaxis protein
MPEQRALVVDDNPTNRMLAVAMLAKLGWTTDEAESGESALRMAEETAYALILLDISMPGLSGEETCLRFRQGRHSQTRIIAYTAHAFPEERARFLAAGFDEILVKPITRQSLSTAISPE